MYKLKNKNYFLCIAVFVVSMLNVSIANVFGGYYCFPAAIASIIATIYACGLFDKKDNIRSDIVNLVLASVLTFMQLVFFVVNDIIKIPVYSSSNLNFWGYCVIGAQVLSIASIIYAIVTLVVGTSRSKIEIVEEYKNETRPVEQEQKEEETQENNQDMEQDEESTIDEVRTLENSVETNVPFMEEDI